MNHTGIFATDEELKQLRASVERARHTPAFALSSKHALEEGGFSGQAWKSTKELCHEFALAHGLPEIPGYYGVSNEGEFVTT